GTAAPDTPLGSYDRAIDALITLLAEPSPGGSNPELSASVLRYVQLARVKELGSRVRRELYAAARAGRYDPNALVKLADLRAQQLAALGEFRVAATVKQLLRYEKTTADPRFANATRLEETTIGGAPAVLDPEAWWNASQQRLQLMGDVQATVLDDAVGEAGSRSAAQLRRSLLVAGAVLAVLVAALLTSVLVGRSIARSLRMLRGQALKVAQVELPEALERLRGVEPDPDIEVSPAAVRSMDEIGDVAEAFVAVQRSAVALAVEQAVMRRNVNAMFVNLARRSQVLVERQLELLDELEREESDPDQLDNLFRLDHLAARMRRNDDSLLVLAGTESSRRWSQPVPLEAVLLAAVAEVEQYQRVRHRVEDPLYVVGHAVADLVHLLAELLENGASFSPPDTLVRIQGSTNAAGGAMIEIIDDGLGMSESALAEASATLAAPPAADVAASQRMGLFVVSHLAARQGVRVVLRPAEVGVLAAVWLPPVLLAEAPAEKQEHRPGRRIVAALEAGPDDVAGPGASTASGRSAGSGTSTAVTDESAADESIAVTGAVAVGAVVAGAGEGASADPTQKVDPSAESGQRSGETGQPSGATGRDDGEPEPADESDEAQPTGGPTAGGPTTAGPAGGGSAAGATEQAEIPAQTKKKKRGRERVTSAAPPVDAPTRVDNPRVSVADPAPNRPTDRPAVA
ncbi:nitrate- and nitrite sensing domain-containing protein, partial [Micromonospora zhanjiangensis]